MRSTARLPGACISSVGGGAEETSAATSALGGRPSVVLGNRTMAGQRGSMEKAQTSPQGLSPPQGGGGGSIQDVLKATQTLEKLSRDEIAMVRHDLKMHVDNTASILRDITAALDAERQSRKAELASMTAKVHDVLGQAAAGIRAELDAAAKVGDKSQALILSVQQDMLDKVEASQRNSDALVDRITGAVLTRLQSSDAPALGAKEATASMLELKDEFAALAARFAETRLEIGEQVSGVEVRLDERASALSDSLKQQTSAMLSREDLEQLQQVISHEGEARNRDMEVLQRGSHDILQRLERTEIRVAELTTATKAQAALPTASTDEMEVVERKLEELRTEAAATREQQASAQSELDSRVQLCAATLESQVALYGSLSNDVMDMQGKLAILRDVQTQLAQLTRDAQKNAAAVEVCQEEIVAGLANLSQSTSKEMEQFEKYIGAQGVDQAELGQGIERLRGGQDDLLARCDSIEKQMLEMTRTAAQVEQSVPAAAVEGLQQQLEELRSTVAAAADQQSATFADLSLQVSDFAATAESQSTAHTRLSSNFVELAKTVQAQQGENLSKMQAAVNTEVGHLRSDMNGRIADLQVVVKSKDTEHAKDLQCVLDRLGALQDTEDARKSRLDFQSLRDQVQGLSDALAAVQVRSQTTITDLTSKLTDLGGKAVAREHEQLAFSEQLRSLSASLWSLQDKLSSSIERRLDHVQSRIEDSQKAVGNDIPVAKEHLARCSAIEESVQKLQLALQAEEGKRLDASMQLKKQIEANSAIQGRQQEEMAGNVANLSSEISTMSSGLTAAEEKLGKLFESDAASQVGLPMMGRKVQDITERLGSVTHQVTMLTSQSDKLESICIELQEHATNWQQRHLQLTDLRHLLSAEVESRQAACLELQETVQRSSKAAASVEHALPDLRSQVASLIAWSHEAKAMLSELIRQSGLRATIPRGLSTDRRDMDAPSPSSAVLAKSGLMSPTTPRRSHQGDKPEPVIAGGLEAAYRAGTSSSPLSGTARARTDHILRSLSQHAAVTQPLGSAEAAKERTVPEASDFGGKKSVDAPNFRRFKDANTAEPLPPPPAPLSLPPSVANPPSWSCSPKLDEKGNPDHGTSTWNWKTHIVEATERDHATGKGGDMRHSARERPESLARAEAYRESAHGEAQNGASSQSSAWYAQFLPSWYGQMEDR